MRIHNLLIILSFCTTFTGLSQDQRKIDSLLSVYNSQPNDSTKINTLELLYEETILNNPDQALKYAQEELEIAQNLDNFKFMGGAHHRIGVYYKRINQEAKAIENYKQAIAYFEKAHYIKGKVMTTNSLAILHYNHAEYQKALDLMGDVNELYTNGQIEKSQYSTYLNIKTVIYLDKGDYNPALQTALKALEIAKADNDELRTTDMISLIGEIEYLMGNYDSSVSYYNEASLKYQKMGNLKGLASNYRYLAETYVAMENIPKAEELLLKALDMAEKAKSQSVKAVVLSLLGKVYRIEKRYSQSIEYLNESIKINTKINRLHSLAQTHIELGITYNELGDYEKAIQEFDKAQELTKDIDVIENLQNIYQNRSISYDKLNKPEQALKDYKLFKEVNDSIFRTEKSKQIEDLLAKYQAEKKEQQIKLQQNEIDLLQITNKNNNLQRLLLGLALLSTLIVVYALYQRNRRNKLQKEKAMTDLEFKTKELTTHALHLAKKNEVLNDLKQKAKVFKADANADPGYQMLIQTINLDLQEDSNWENFTKYFEEVHKDFNKRAQEQFPKVTTNDLRLMALLKMNLSSKEIANILNITSDGIKKARQRLRKKMGLESDKSLEAAVIAI